MNRYNLITPLADHSYSSVFKAQNKQTNEIVAIRQLKKKYYTWEEVLSLREIKVLRVLQHPNIMVMKEIIRNKEELFIVFEYIEQTLYKFYQDKKDKGSTIFESEIKQFIYQIATTLNYIHKAGFFHRDLTVDAIYIDDNLNIKIGHFINSRELGSRFAMTDYITTRWYRAPEQLLRISNYNFKIDVFAIGCVFGELLNMGPLFQGASELDQLNKICQVLGTPNQTEWPEFFSIARKLNIKLQEIKGTGLQAQLPTASPEAIDLLSKMLIFNPSKRPSFEEILKHPFFQTNYNSDKQDKSRISKNFLPLPEATQSILKQNKSSKFSNLEEKKEDQLESSTNLQQKQQQEKKDNNQQQPQVDKITLESQVLQINENDMSSPELEKNNMARKNSKEQQQQDSDRHSEPKEEQQNLSQEDHNQQDKSENIGSPEESPRTDKQEEKIEEFQEKSNPTAKQASGNFLSLGFGASFKPKEQNMDYLKSDKIFSLMQDHLQQKGNEIISKINSIYHIGIVKKIGEKVSQFYTINLKQSPASISKGKEGKADAVFIISDDDVINFASGTINLKKLLIKGRIKFKGNIQSLFKFTSDLIPEFPKL